MPCLLPPPTQKVDILAEQVVGFQSRIIQQKFYFVSYLIAKSCDKLNKQFVTKHG